MHPKVTRHLRTFALAASAVLSVLFLALWVRSYSVMDEVGRNKSECGWKSCSFAPPC